MKKKFENPLFQVFGTIAIISLFVFLKNCTKRPEICQVNSEEVDKISVQLNVSIYNEIFGNQNCSPQTLTLFLPSNSNSNKNKPRVSTFLTFTSQEKSFYIRRIDRLKNGDFYTDKDSCLSWKWSKRNDSLQLSMERNLEIEKPNIKDIVFIISLPLEVRNANNNIIIRPYTWERSGIIYNSNFAQNYPLLKDTLRRKDRRDPNEKRIKYGQKVSDDITKELSQVKDSQGIYVDHILWEKIQENKPEKYRVNPDRSDCAVSQYFE